MALLCLLPAALIRGNRKNCAQFSGSLDWLISRLERLEASSGKSARRLFSSFFFKSLRESRRGEVHLL